MNVIDTFYNVQPTRLIGLMIALGAFLLPLTLWFLRVDAIFWLSTIPLICWAAFLIFSALAHGLQALWLALTAPIALFWPAVYGTIILGCLVWHECL